MVAYTVILVQHDKQQMWKAMHDSKGLVDVYYCSVVTVPLADCHLLIDAGATRHAGDGRRHGSCHHTLCGGHGRRDRRVSLFGAFKFPNTH